MNNYYTTLLRKIKKGSVLLLDDGVQDTVISPKRIIKTSFTGIRQLREWGIDAQEPDRETQTFIELEKNGLVPVKALFNTKLIQRDDIYITEFNHRRRWHMLSNGMEVNKRGKEQEPKPCLEVGEIYHEKYKALSDLLVTNGRFEISIPRKHIPLFLEKDIFDAFHTEHKEYPDQTKKWVWEKFIGTVPSRIGMIDPEKGNRLDNLCPQRDGIYDMKSFYRVRSKGCFIGDYLTKEEADEVYS